jgi:hypothetical protein
MSKENKSYKINTRFRIKTRSQNVVIVFIPVLQYFRITRTKETLPNRNEHYFMWIHDDDDDDDDDDNNNNNDIIFIW